MHHATVDCSQGFACSVLLAVAMIQKAAGAEFVFD
jgi:hypothetical protein